MSFLHTWRRWTDIEYRWETAPEQAILDSQDDLLAEIRELRHVVSQMSAQRNDHSGLDPVFTRGMTAEQIKHIKYMLDVIDNG